MTATLPPVHDAPPGEPERRVRLRDWPEAAPPGLAALAAAAAAATGCATAAIVALEQGELRSLAQAGTPLLDAAARAACRPLVAAGLPLELPDARLDAAFAGAAALRFVAAFPLRAPGAAPAALLLLDGAPRRLDAAQRGQAEALAEAAARLLALPALQAEVERQRARLMDFARASGDWMWETDAALRYTWISGTYEAVTGVPVAQWLGRRIVDAPLLDAQGRPLADGSTLHGLMGRAQPFSRALTEQVIDGKRLYVSRSAVPVADGAGAHAGWRGTSRDVTARLALSERAREREQLLGRLAANLPGIIFQFRRHADGRISYPYVSPRVREIYGIEPPRPDQVRDAELALRMLLPEDRPRFLASIEASARELAPWQLEYRIVRADGEVRWLESRSTPQRLPDGSLLWHGFSADVTERKRTELALHRTEAQWALAAEAAGIGLATLDMHDGSMSFDRRACDNHGLPYPCGPMTLDDWYAAMGDEDRTRVAQGLRRALEQHATLETRYRTRRPDGSLRVLEIVARPVLDARGAATGLVGTCRDISEQVAAEQLRRDKESAERANRAKTEFLSRVSHELRTPLNSILGFAQLMALDAQHPLPPPQRKRLEHVQQAGGHLLGLINDVLELTRIEQPGVTLRCAPVDAARALRACLATLQPLALEHEVRLPPRLPPAPAETWVLADARALEQVLMNLLSNAIKYNRRGGKVELALARREGGARLAIAVRDEGPGLTPEQQAGLFQPFNRLGAEQRRIEGSGLGLVIARELTRAMHGELTVESRPGAGARFTLELPACAEPAREAPPPTTQTPADASITGRRQLLYIEDEPLNVLLLQEVVRTRAEWALEVTGDGASGLERARALRPDLVLIDMNLPDTTGLALIRALRGDPRTAALRCVALSADAMREQIEAARGAGFDDYWTKPIDVVRMLGTLSALLADSDRAL